jgi:hypothetical protein
MKNEIIQEAKDDYKSLLSFCTTSYQHLLKWKYNKKMQSSSWTRSIHESIISITRMAGYNKKTRQFKGNYINTFEENREIIFNDAIKAAREEGNNIPDNCRDVLNDFYSLETLINRNYIFTWMAGYAKDFNMKASCTFYMENKN